MQKEYEKARNDLSYKAGCFDKLPYIIWRKGADWSREYHLDELKKCKTECARLRKLLDDIYNAQNG